MSKNWKDETRKQVVSSLKYFLKTQSARSIVQAYRIGSHDEFLNELYVAIAKEGSASNFIETAASQQEIQRYVFVVAKRRLIDLGKKKRARESVVRLDDIEQLQTPVHARASSAVTTEIDRLKELIPYLHPQLRDVALLRINGCDNAAIANHLGIHPRTVIRRWKSATMILRSQANHN